ncbi:hypothetical protein LTS10_009645 [Elasticomyces elasticus]|nr:hypothetical protein LTS10_009645 [Elasticomyces elasticus]
MNSSLFTSAQHTEAETCAISLYLQMGFLNHTHQYHALRHLVWRHLEAQGNANNVDFRKLNESQLDDVANHFMEKYEQRLYVREGRYQMDSDERRQDTIDTGKEPVQFELRRMSELAGLVTKYLEVVKDAERPETSLTQEELLRCVLAGVDYVGNGQTMAGVPDLSKEERVLQAL